MIHWHCPAPAEAAAFLCDVQSGMCVGHCALCIWHCAIVHPQSGFCVNLTSFHFDTAFFLDAAAITISAIVQPLFEPLATLSLWQLTAKRSLCICQDKTPWLFHLSPFTRYPFTQLNSCVMLICILTKHFKLQDCLACNCPCNKQNSLEPHWQ